MALRRTCHDLAATVAPDEVREAIVQGHHADRLRWLCHCRCA
jgi:hypothetical protein